MTDTESLLITLEGCFWHVARRPSDYFLPGAVRKRYRRLPEEIEAFLGAIDACTNKDKTVWFLTHQHYGEDREERLRWNEHELMSLRAAGDDSTQWDRIRAFWDHHFPFLFAVHSDYDYLAVDLTPETFGQIVHGCASFAEEPSLVARSFPEFVLMFIETLRGNRRYPVSLFT